MGRAVLGELYGRVAEILDGVAFGEIYPAFHRFPFALYDDNTVFLEGGEIVRDGRFLANTAIEFDGKPLAIWNAESAAECDPQLLAADLVHEMFHAFQNECGEKDYPDDLFLTAYPDDTDNHCARAAENKYLVKAYGGDKNAYLDFCASRAFRTNVNGVAVAQELKAENIEGGAEFAACKALREIAPEKFGKRIEKYLNALSVVDSSFFDVRRYAYYTGAVLGFVRERFGATGEIAPKKPALSEKDVETVESALKTRRAAVEREFDGFYKKRRTETAGDFIICGYDPMNMVKRGDQLLCKHFVMLKKKDAKEPMFLRGPVVVIQTSENLRVCTAYRI